MTNEDLLGWALLAAFALVGGLAAMGGGIGVWISGRRRG